MKHFDADAVNRLLAERPISLVSLAPTMLSRLLDAKMRNRGIHDSDWSCWVGKRLRSSW